MLSGPTRQALGGGVIRVETCGAAQQITALEYRILRTPDTRVHPRLHDPPVATELLHINNNIQLDSKWIRSSAQNRVPLKVSDYNENQVLSHTLSKIKHMECSQEIDLFQQDVSNQDLL